MCASWLLPSSGTRLASTLSGSNTPLSVGWIFHRSGSQPKFLLAEAGGSD